MWRKEIGEWRLWALVMGCLEIPPGFEKMWFLGNITQASIELGLETYGELERMMKGLIWFQELFGARLQLLWEEMTSSEAHATRVAIEGVKSCQS